MLDKIFGAIMFGTSGNGNTASSSIMEIGAVVILTILIAYVVGLMISHIVDKKLGDIEIKMPQVNVQSAPVSPDVSNYASPQIVFKISEGMDGKINIRPDNESSGNDKSKDITILPKETVYNHPNKITTSEPFLSVTFDDEKGKSINQKQIRQSVNTNTSGDSGDPNEVKTSVKNIIGCTRDEDCNTVYGGGKNVCKSDGKCYCLTGSGPFCQYGPTNYKDPKDMTVEERQRFKWKYRSNMTLQDYKNWLYLYKDEIENLRQHHRRNLLKLLRGGQLTERDVPAVQIKPPTDAADYFQKMYKGGKISVHFPDNDSPLVGANYNQYTDFIAPENTASSWITGVVDLYKETKDDAKALDWNLRPESNNGFEEQTVGDIYQKYIKKQHDFSDLRKIAHIINEKERAQIPIRQNKSLLTFDNDDPNAEPPQ